jgi:hypothetical protein
MILIRVSVGVAEYPFDRKQKSLPLNVALVVPKVLLTAPSAPVAGLRFSP